MLLSRRRPKNSLLGVHVCAPWKDGFYYSGIIEAVKSKPTGENTYTILFEDDYIAEVDEGEIVGPGFKSIGASPLKTGQHVYITYKSREVGARVLKIRSEFNEVLVQILDQHETIVAVRPSEIHLMKGQRYSSVPMELKGSNGTSSFVSSPVPCKMRAHGIHSYDGCTNRQENVTRSEEMAALVLTALSISPVFKEADQTDEMFLSFPPTPDSGSEMATFSSPGNSPLRSSSPVHPNDSNFFFSGPPSPVDEGIGVDIQKQENTRKRKTSTSSSSSVKTLYKCTWPRCGKTLSTAPGIIRHVRTIHLGPKRSTEEGYSDGEEDFYFNEIDLEEDDYMNDHVFPTPLVLSPTPTQSHFDMVKNPWTEPGAEVSPSGCGSPQHPRFNWDASAITSLSTYLPPSKASSGKTSPSRVQHNSHLHTHRKVRGESKKCRKVYGMENRHLWCTQCRWKKACVRFAD